MEFISGLKFRDFWWFPGLWLLFLFCPGSNWNTKLVFGDLGGSWPVSSGSCGSDGLGWFSLRVSGAISGLHGQHGSGSSGSGSSGLACWHGTEGVNLVCSPRSL